MRQLRMVTTWVAALALVSMAGCDDNTNPGTDSGPGPGTDGGVTLMDSGPGSDDAGPTGTDAGTDAGGGGSCTGPSGPCNALDATSCGSGMACVLSGSSDTMWQTVCIMAGAGTQGSACDPTMQGQCAEGFQCSSTSSVCEKICCETADCSPGDFCGLVAGAEAGFCSTPDDCDLIAQTGCPAMQGCYPSSGGLACLGAGTVAEGATCMFTNDCMPGFGCLGPSGGPSACRAWCDMAAMPTTCPTGFACTGVTGLPVGACTPTTP
ncbi:MAG: hypothetical protein H6719_05790 [Sandaracinaceae bacterium]|nr:hypothetical protein [Sandaracinaceae bacterium]